MSPTEANEYAQAFVVASEGLSQLDDVITSVLVGVLVMLIAILCFVRKEAVWQTVLAILRTLNGKLRGP